MKNLAKSQKPSYNFWIVALLVVGLGVGLFFAIKQELVKVDKFESEKLKVMLFHASWCPHCRDYLSSGVWTQQLKNVVKTDPKFAGVVLMDFEFEDNKQLAEKYNVDRFPYILAENSNGKVYQFSGNRNNVEDLKDFILKSLA